MSDAGDRDIDRAAGRVDAWLDRRLGYHPLAIRLNYRHGFHAERMQPKHPNWMLDTDRDGRLSQRELRSAWSRLEARDRDRDGAIVAVLDRRFPIHGRRVRGALFD